MRLGVFVQAAGHHVSGWRHPDAVAGKLSPALMQHIAVRDCAVVGLPDDKWGERVTAVVEEFGSTTVVFPGQSLQVDPHGILIVQRCGVPGEAAP